MNPKDYQHLVELAQKPSITRDQCYLKSSWSMTPALQEFFAQEVRDNPWQVWFNQDRTFWSRAYDPVQIRDLDPFVNLVVQDLGVVKMSMLYTQARTAVESHIDTYRKCSINCLLTPATGTTYWNTSVRRQEQWHMIESNFTQNDYYLFNGSRKHGVIVRDDPRIVFSMDIPECIDYQQLVIWSGLKKHTAKQFKR